MSTADLPSTPLGAVVRGPEGSTETSQVARLLWLRALFGDASSGRRMEALVARMTEFYLPKGKDLYVEGTTSDSMYFIVEGEVSHGTHGYTRYVSGDVLGFVDSMVDRPHRHTAHVEQDAVILRLKIDDWLEHLEEHFTELRNMVASTASNNDAHPDEEDNSEALRWAEEANHAAPGATGQLVRRLLAVKTCPLFRRASIQSIAQLVRRGETILLPKGGALADGDQKAGLYVLLSGSVHCTMGPDGEAIEWKTRTPGALLGSVSLLLQLPAVLKVEAREDTELLYFDPEDYFDVMEDHFDVARSALSYFAQRAEARNYRKGREQSADN